jgi:hypothetical protein
VLNAEEYEAKTVGKQILADAQKEIPAMQPATDLTDAASRIVAAVRKAG